MNLSAYIQRIHEIYPPVLCLLRDLYVAFYEEEEMTLIDFAYFVE